MQIKEKQQKMKVKKKKEIDVRTASSSQSLSGSADSAQQHKDMLALSRRCKMQMSSQYKNSSQQKASGWDIHGGN